MQVMVNNFTAGEISKKLLARHDLEKYKNGCKELRDFFIQAQGGVYGRPGTRYVASAKYADKKCRLLPFEFSSLQAYIIEAGDLYMRFYKDGGQIVSGVPVEIVTPYTEAMLFTVKLAQSADVMYLSHVSIPPQKITRTSHTAWSIAPVEFIDGPYMTANKDPAKTLTASVNTVGATGTLTATGHTPFLPAHVGTSWRLSTDSGVTWGWVKVTGYTSSTVVDITVKAVTSAASATSLWREGAFSSVRGYPRALGFFEERLFFASTDAQPQTLWGSVNGDFETMRPGTADDDAVEYTVASSYVNPFHWLAEDRGIFMGTTKSEFRLGGGDSPLSPSNARVVPQTRNGSRNIQPVNAGNSTLFVQRAGKKVRALKYNFNSDSYIAPDLTILADHITKPGITDWCYQQEPDSILACVLSDGDLSTMTYIADQDVQGWSRHRTQGLFESCACIPIAEEDQVWVVVQRTVGGSTVRYIEYFDPLLHMDCALSYSGVPALSVSGLGHLEGRAVNVIGDGAVYNSAVVTGGAITLAPVQASSAIDVGLAFTPRLVMLRPEMQTQNGSMQGLRKHYVKIGVRVLDTAGVTVNGTQAESRSSEDLMDEAPATFTGDLIDVSTGWDKDAENVIEQTQSLPINILGVFGTLESEG